MRLKAKLIREISALYLFALIVYCWGIISYRYDLFPWSFIRPIVIETLEFLTFSEGINKTYFDKITLDHQQHRTNFDIDGLHYRDDLFSDDGYLLISRYSQTHEQVIIELLSLEKNVVLHRWIPPLDSIFKQSPKYSKSANTHIEYRAQHPLLLPGGDIVFTSGEGPLVRMKACGDIKWIIERHFHHSIELDADGNLVIPMIIEPQKAETVFPLRDDGFAIVNLNGKILKEYSVTDILLKNEMQGLVYGIGKFEYDRIHLNDAQPILVDNNEAKRGDIALSVRHLSTVFLFRPSTNKIIWLRTGPWLNQHDINQLDSGAYSIFGNDVIRNKTKFKSLINNFSEIYIYNPITNKISTPYSKAMHEYQIYTPTEGRLRIMENGDAFIELTDLSRLIRISRENKIRWEYVNMNSPGIAGALHWTRYISNDQIDLSWKEHIKCN